MCLESEEAEWKCYCEGLRLAVAGAEEMKLLSLSLLKEQTWNVQFNLGRPDSYGREGDEWILTSRSNWQNSKAQTPDKHQIYLRTFEYRPPAARRQREYRTT